MSLKKDDSNSHDQTATVKQDLQKKPKFSYTRDFLLSLSELDVCKKLPSGFDKSIIAEFEEASNDRQRVSGGYSLNGFRQNEYGSSPPSRPETTNNSRRIHVKREVHSSGRSDKDSDSQSDRDSVDSGWRNGDHSKKSAAQGPEHDGLLGSGSFPRPSGYATAFSAPKVRPHDPHQLNRSNEPYHPPRLYKAVAHQRANTNDSFNDETFGSSEHTSEDKVEEEKKRRDLFESMRKEQHRAFQVSHKSNPVKKRDEFDILMQLDEAKDDKKLPNTSSGFDESISLQSSKNDREKSFPSQTTVSRPLVPPGFTSTVLEKNYGTKSSNPHLWEGKDDIDKSLQTKGVQLQNGISEEEKSSSKQLGHPGQYGKTSINASTNNTSENIIERFSGVDMSNKTTGIDVQSLENSFEVYEASENSAVVDLKTEKVTVNTAIGEPSQGHSSLILEKLFGSAMKLDGDATNFDEQHDNEMNDACSSQNAQSSKFAHWFMDNDHRKKEDNLSPKWSTDLLTMIRGGEGSGYDALCDVKHSEQSLPTVSFQDYESAESNIISSATTSNVAKTEAVSAILTCEAVEQTLLLKFNETDLALQPSDQRWSQSDAEVKHPTVKSDDNASLHLLSLLQKGSSHVTVEYGDDSANIGSAIHSKNEENTHNISDPGKSLTLETLFGSAFMKELQTAGAPVSAHRGCSSGSVKSDVSESRGLITDDGLLSNNEIRHGMINHDNGNQRQQNQPDIVRGQRLSLNGPRPDLDSSHPHAKLGHKIGRYDGAPTMAFPEEDSLIISDSMNFQNFITNGTSAKPQQLFSHNTQDSNAAIFNASFNDERPSMGGLEGLPFSAGPYDRREAEMPHRKASVRSNFSQLHPQLTNNGKLFHQFESHLPNMNSQRDLMLPEGMVHHNSLPNHQFVANMHRSPTTGLSGFDHSIHHPIMQQMQSSVNVPPQHLLQGLSRGAPPPMANRSTLHPQSIRGRPAPPQPNDQVSGSVQELNPIQGFHLGQRVPNIDGPRILSPAPGNQPDAIQRLLQMGHRSNTKQIHLASGGHGQGMYGHELNMGYRYR